MQKGLSKSRVFGAQRLGKAAYMATGLPPISFTSSTMADDVLALLSVEVIDSRDRVRRVSTTSDGQARLESGSRGSRVSLRFADCEIQFSGNDGEKW